MYRYREEGAGWWDELGDRVDIHTLRAVLVTQSCLSLCDPMDCSPPGSSVHRNSPGKKTGVGCHALLQAYIHYSV